MSGRIASIAVDPGNANHWMVGTARGGVWETTDAGTMWRPKTDDQASLATGAVAYAPSNSNIVYVGTGEPDPFFAGAGLLKSTDGGATWQLLAASTFGKNAVSAIKVHPTNPNTLIATTYIGNAGRDEAPPPSPPARGIYRSTDGGQTWSRTLTALSVSDL